MKFVRFKIIIIYNIIIIIIYINIHLKYRTSGVGCCDIISCAMRFSELGGRGLPPVGDRQHRGEHGAVPTVKPGLHPAISVHQERTHGQSLYGKSTRLRQACTVVYVLKYKAHPRQYVSFVHSRYWVFQERNVHFCTFLSRFSQYQMLWPPDY